MQHVLYLQSTAKLSVSNNALSIEEESKGETIIAVEDVVAIVIESIYSIVTIPALLLCVRHQVAVILCNEKHQPEIFCVDYYRHHLLLDCLQKQISWQIEHKRHAWLFILNAKLIHQIEVLNFYQPDHLAIGQISDYRASLTEVGLSDDRINTAESISARVYFSALFGAEFKRFEQDTINSALNYGYALIRSMVNLAIVAKGLHPTLGIWHHSVRNRFNLADDLLEIFRPLVDHHVSQLDCSIEFNKQHRQQLLSLLYHRVWFKDKRCSLKQAINLYLDEFIRFMQQESDIIDTPELRINCDE